MTVNPYLAPPAAAQFTPAPIAAPVKAPAPAKRKSDKLMMTGAVIGLVVGLMTTYYAPQDQFLAGTEQSDTFAFIFGRATGAMILGAVAGLFVSWVIAHPICGIVFIGGMFGCGALILNSVGPRWSKVTPARVVDLTRHREPGRLQAGNDGFSLIPPANWKQVPTDKSIFKFVGPTQHGFATTIELKANESEGPITTKWLVVQTHLLLPPNSTVQEVGNLRIDGQPAYFIEGNLKESGNTIWLAMYSFQGKDKIYQLIARGSEPKSLQAERTVRELVNSVRID